jgi:hypothetical protein
MDAKKKIRCDNISCPVKESCKRYLPSYNNAFIYWYTESPGRYCEVSGKKKWVCDKKLEHE